MPVRPYLMSVRPLSEVLCRSSPRSGTGPVCHGTASVCHGTASVCHGLSVMGPVWSSWPCLVLMALPGPCLSVMAVTVCHGRHCLSWPSLPSLPSWHHGRPGIMAVQWATEHATGPESTFIVLPIARKVAFRTSARTSGQGGLQDLSPRLTGPVLKGSL